MATALCPECEADVEVAVTAEPDDELSCNDCGADLYVAGIDPIELEILDEHEDDEDEY